jgi:hypothetical protein
MDPTLFGEMQTQDFIKAVERLIANDAAVRTAVGGGGVYAAGSYKVCCCHFSPRHRADDTMTFLLAAARHRKFGGEW